MDEKGVSPMAATLMLIALVFAIGAIISSIIFGWPRPAAPYGGEFVIENVTAGNDNLRITHTGGPACTNAFSVENLAVTWKNLELKVNGISEGMKCSYATSRGAVVVDHPTDNSEPAIDLTAFDVFVVNVRAAIGRALKSGDEIALIYTPQNTPLVFTEVPPA